MRVLIETAQPADAPDMLALQHAAYAQEAARYPEAPIPPVTEALADLVRDMAAHTYLKAVVDGRIVGAVRGRQEGELCHVGRLMVEPALQGRGIGTELLRAIELYFPDARCFELFTGSRSESNLRLYRRMGYEEARRELVGPEMALVYLRKERG